MAEPSFLKETGAYDSGLFHLWVKSSLQIFQHKRKKLAVRKRQSDLVVVLFLTASF
jgi:hypothetical protein